MYELVYNKIYKFKFCTKMCSYFYFFILTIIFYKNISLEYYKFLFIVGFHNIYPILDQNNKLKLDHISIPLMLLHLLNYSLHYYHQH